MAMIDLEHAAAQAYDLGHQFACIIEQKPSSTFDFDKKSLEASQKFYEFFTNDDRQSLSVRLAVVNVQIRELQKNTNEYLKHQWLYYESQKKKAFDKSNTIESYYARSQIVKEFDNIEKLYTGSTINSFMSKGSSFERNLANMDTPDKIITLAKRRMSAIEELTKPPELGTNRLMGKRSS